MIEKELIEHLKKEVDLHATACKCYRRLSELLTNGRIKKKFSDMAEYSQKIVSLIPNKIKDITGEEYKCNIFCKKCKLKEEELSLSGALNLGLEILNKSLDLYRKIIKVDKSPEDKRVFKEVMKELKNQYAFLRKEKKRHVFKGPLIGCIDGYCIPEVFSDFWQS